MAIAMRKHHMEKKYHVTEIETFLEGSGSDPQSRKVTLQIER